MGKVNSKQKVCGIQINVKPMGIPEWKTVFVGNTTRDENTFLNEHLAAIGNPLFSQKFANLKRPNRNSVRVTLLCVTDDIFVNSKVNKFIERYDTIKNGWNTELR